MGNVDSSYQRVTSCVHVEFKVRVSDLKNAIRQITVNRGENRSADFVDVLVSECVTTFRAVGTSTDIPVNGIQPGTVRLPIATLERFSAMAKASENLRDATILAVDTGMRPNSELFPLKWADVDLTTRAECPHGVIHVRQGKTDSAQRSLPLTPRAAEVLQRRKAAAEATAEQSAFVFAGTGLSGHITSWQHPHKATIEAAGLESFEFYCWRHTFGTRAAQSGMDRFTLARLMGHSSQSVAARYYIHVTETHVAAGFEKFVEYQTRETAAEFAKAFPPASEAVQ
jgi:integrase